MTSVAYDPNGDLYVALSVFAQGQGTPCRMHDAVPVGNGAMPRFSLDTSGVVLARYQTSVSGDWQNVSATLPAASSGFVTVDPTGGVVVAYRYRSAETRSLSGLAAAVPATRSDDILVVSYAQDAGTGAFGPRAFVLGGSPGDDVPTQVTTDPWGNVIVGGTGAPGFAIGGASGVGTGAGAAADDSVAVVFKCRADLATCPWARLSGGGVTTESVDGVVVDGSGRTTAVGTFRPPTAPLGPAVGDAGAGLGSYVELLAP